MGTESIRAAPKNESSGVERRVRRSDVKRADGEPSFDRVNEFRGEQHWYCGGLRGMLCGGFYKGHCSVADGLLASIRCCSCFPLADLLTGHP